MEWLHDQPALMFAAVFLARVLDVSIGTIRTITVVRGYRLLTTVLGFFEVLIWVVAAGQVLTNLNQWYLVLGWAGGYATGNAVGIWLKKHGVRAALFNKKSSANDDSASRLEPTKLPWGFCFDEQSGTIMFGKRPALTDRGCLALGQ